MQHSYIMSVNRALDLGNPLLFTPTPLTVTSIHWAFLIDSLYNRIKKLDIIILKQSYFILNHNKLYKAYWEDKEMSNTKIVVIKLKQIIYGAIFAALGIILIILLITLFKSGNDSSSTTDDVAKYVPGKYTSVVSLNDTNLNLEIVVDENHINSVRIVNIDEAIKTMFPLVEPSINDISEQLCNDVDIASVEIAEESKYTQSLLLDAVEQTLAKALIAVTEE